MMTHIYKVYRAAAGALLLTAALAACTDDSREPMQENETPREGIFFSVTATQGEGADTRVEYQLNGNQGMDVTWAREDKIYVGKLTNGYLNTGNLSLLTLKSGDEGGITAQFEGEVKSNHLPADGATLYAVYGKAEKIEVSGSDIYYDYTGQRQTANDDMKHAAEYDFMTASTEYTPGSNHHFSFSHVGSMMKFALYGLADQTVNKLTLSTYDGSKPFNGSQSVSLDLGVDSSNGISLGSGGTLKAYLMVEPTTETAGKNFVLYVTTTDGKNYVTLLTGANIDAGKLYTIDATLNEYTFTGTGTSGDPYKITDTGDLTKLAVMTNTGMMDTQGQYFQLTNDINMEMGAEAWLPIGIFNKQFKGIFSGAKADGGNYSILNLPGKMAGRYAGLFGSLNDATIKNVTVSGEITISGADWEAYAGGIAGDTWNSTIADCNSSCTINISGTGSYIYAGGIIGYNGIHNEVTNCTNMGKVSSSKYSGGIIGYAMGKGEITNCTNSGEITSTSTEYPAGGIIGYWEASSITRFTLTGCTHSGSSPASNKAGSIIGGYKIPSYASKSSITIKNGANDSGTTINGIAGQDVTGKWPENDIN